MTEMSVDYNQIATTYHQRYAVSNLNGIAGAIAELIGHMQAEYVLEVGCGTGRWLWDVQNIVDHLYGIDPFVAMLQEARQHGIRCALVGGNASHLPFAATTFDIVFCVNAIHHFRSVSRFIAEARRVLRAGGRLAIVGIDPQACRDNWYVYRYFEGVYEYDLQRFPTWTTVEAEMKVEGFESIQWQVIEHSSTDKYGREVFTDPFLQKHSSSQLALLSDEAYRAGVQRIEAALAKAESVGEVLVFPMTITFEMMVGQIPGVVRCGS